MNTLPNNSSKVIESLDTGSAAGLISHVSDAVMVINHNGIIENIQSGFICCGQNWKGMDVVDTQKRVHSFYGFKPNDKFYWNWQYTNKITDESKESYKEAFPTFVKKFKIDDLY